MRMENKRVKRTPIKKQYEYYSKYSNEYERAIWKLDKYRILKSYKILEDEKPGKILDVGCLAGRDMIPLKKRWDCYGVEISDAGWKAVERGIMCIHCDVSKSLPFRDACFDAIWAEEIIEHLIDTDYFLSECYRILKKKGILLLSTPNLASLINRFRLLFGKYPRYMQVGTENPGHIRYYISDILKSQLSCHGFIVEKIIGNFLSFPDPTQGKYLRRFLLSPMGTILPTLSENLIVKARKK